MSGKISQLAALASASIALNDLLLITDTSAVESKSLTASALRQFAQGIFNVKDYGAAGNTQTISDGAMTNGQAVLTSASGLFVPGDVGKVCTVSGAGTGTTPLSTTIIAYSSATQVALGANAARSVTGKVIVWGTDDTATIQAALDACAAANGGMVWIPRGNYLYSAPMICSGVSENAPLKGVLIQGERGATLVHKPGVIFPTGLLTGCALLIHYADYAVFRDIIFLGQPDYETGVMDVVCYQTGVGRGAIFQDVVVVNHWRGLMVDYSGTEYAIVSGCYFKGCGQAAIGQTSLAGTAVITGNVVEVSGTSLDDLDTPIIHVAGVDTIVEGNTLDVPRGYIGIGIHGGADHIVVSNNTIRGTAKTTGAEPTRGIYVYDAASAFLTIANNNLRGCDVAIQSDATYSSINGNVIEGSNSSAEGIRLYRATNPAAYNAVVGNVMNTLAVGVTGNDLAVDHTVLSANVFGAGVTAAVNITNWTNSKVVGNIGVADS